METRGGVPNEEAEILCHIYPGGNQHGTGGSQPFAEQLASGGTRSRLCGRPVFEGDERFGKETVKSTYRPAPKPLVLLQNTAVFLMP